VYSARPGRSGARDAIYRRAAHPYYRVDVANTLHLDFSDMGLWDGPLRQRPVLGSIAPVRAGEITAAIVRQYFDQEFSGAALDGVGGDAGFSGSQRENPSRIRALKRRADVFKPNRIWDRCASAYNRAGFSPTFDDRESCDTMEADSNPH